MVDMIELNPAEFIRIYHLRDGNTIKLENVTHFFNGTSTHRLKLFSGKYIIVPKENIMYIEIEVDKFTL